MIIVLRSLATQFTITSLFPTLNRHTNPSSSSPHPAIGHIQSLLFTPLAHHSPSSNPPMPFCVTNVYFSQPGPRQLEELASLRALPIGPHHFLGGDFNFTEYADDSPSPTSTRLISGAAKEAWAGVVQRLQLQEVVQPTHTHYHISSTLSASHTSRLDRIYTSHTIADLSLVVPSAFVPSTEVNILQAYTRVSNNPTSAIIKSQLTSDHLPVCLTFTAAAPALPRTDRNVPRWMSTIDSVRKDIDSHWTGMRVGETGYSSLDRWKTAIRLASAHYYKHSKTTATNYTDTAAELSACIRLLKMCCSPKPDLGKIHIYLDRHPQLLCLVDIAAVPGVLGEADNQHTIRSALLRARIESILTAGIISDSDPSRFHPDDTTNPTTDPFETFLPPPPRTL
jgi:hypothetical protein